MGYTHYWKIKSDSKVSFIEAVKLFKECLACEPLKDIALCGSYGNRETTPTINGACVCFNGVEENSHETFYIELGDKNFQFCKTAHKPYDLAVCVCLLCFKEVFGNDMELSSDGDMKREPNWLLAKQIVEHINQN